MAKMASELTQIIQFRLGIISSKTIPICSSIL